MSMFRILRTLIGATLRSVLSENQHRSGNLEKESGDSLDSPEIAHPRRLAASSAADDNCVRSWVCNDVLVVLLLYRLVLTASVP